MSTAKEKSSKKVSKKKAKKKVVKKSSKAKTGSKKTMKIGDYAKQLLLEGGRTSDEVIKEVAKKFPKSKCDKKAVSWYRWKMQKDGIEVPKLPKN